MKPRASNDVARPRAERHDTLMAGVSGDRSACWQLISGPTRAVSRFYLPVERDKWSVISFHVSEVLGDRG